MNMCDLTLLSKTMKSCMFLVAVVVSGVYCQSSHLSVVKDFEEICENEVFSPKCKEDHLVLITNAQYGRMRKGRCVQKDYGSLGCGANVIKITDARCSGRHTCSIDIPETDFAKATTCPEDLKPYLQVSYKCVKFHNPDVICHNRQSPEPIPINTYTGYLTSNVTLRTSCGTDTAPWLIQSKRGQIITITLYDFTTSEEGPHRYCFAKVREYTNKGDHVDISVCKGANRERVVLRTNSTKVEVMMHYLHKGMGDRVAYLIKYDVDGCQDPTPPANAWVQRTGDDAIIKCNFSRDISQLKCQGRKWEGHMINCSGAATYTEPENIPFEVSILIVLIIALVIGLVVLILGLLFLKRQHSLCYSRPVTHREVHGKDYMTASYYQTSTYAPKPTQTAGNELQPCTPLMGPGRESAYGQLPPSAERLACGCPVYMTRDEMQNQQNIHNQSFPPCSAKLSTNAADVLTSCSAANTERVVIGPDMLPFNERQIFVNTLERSPKRFAHTTFKPPAETITTNISRDLNLPTRDNKEKQKQFSSLKTKENSAPSLGSRSLLKNNSTEGSGDQSDSEASAFMPKH